MVDSIFETTTDHILLLPQQMNKLGDAAEAPCALVGTKNDLEFDRMVSAAEGRRRAQEIGCFAYFDISVRETSLDTLHVFEELYRHFKTSKKQRWYTSRAYKRHVTSLDPSPPSPRKRYDVIVSMPPESGRLQEHSGVNIINERIRLF